MNASAVSTWIFWWFAVLINAYWPCLGFPRQCSALRVVPNTAQICSGPWIVRIRLGACPRSTQRSTNWIKLDQVGRDTGYRPYPDLQTSATVDKFDDLCMCAIRQCRRAMYAAICCPCAMVETRYVCYIGSGPTGNPCYMGNPSSWIDDHPIWVHNPTLTMAHLRCLYVSSL